MTRTSANGISLFLCLSVMTVFLLCTADVTAGVHAGMKLCYCSVIPSVFPFAVLSSYLSAQRIDGDGGHCNRLFARLFRLPSSALLPFAVGLICGFPLGAKATADGYRRGIYTREEAERMLCFCNNTGVSFLVAGVGASMRESVRDGILLFLVQTLIAALTALLLARGKPLPAPVMRSCAPVAFSFTAAVTGAVSSTLCVSGFVVFFSALLSMARSYFPPVLYLGVAAVSEVGSACSAAASIPGGLALTGFAVCFSGLSVHLQSAAMLSGTDLSMRRALLTKTLSGLAAGGTLYLLSRFLA